MTDKGLGLQGGFQSSFGAGLICHNRTRFRIVDPAVVKRPPEGGPFDSRQENAEQGSLAATAYQDCSESQHPEQEGISGRFRNGHTHLGKGCCRDQVIEGELAHLRKTASSVTIVQVQDQPSDALHGIGTSGGGNWNSALVDRINPQLGGGGFGIVANDDHVWSIKGQIRGAEAEIALHLGA